MSHPLFEQHRAAIENACRAIRARTCYSAYPEAPSGKIYGETAKDDGAAAFQARLNKPFDLDIPGARGTIGAERSPYGVELGVQYPRVNLDALLQAAAAAQRDWGAAEVQARVGVCLEILDRLNKRSFEMALAVMHTTGQGYVMAFQAGGPHAQDRGLEAVAYAYEEMMRTPPTAEWTKQVSKTDSVTFRKHYRIVPRGVAVLVACSTFPTWNGYPGLFASLATGNAVIVKPHPGAILPLAITVEIARAVLREQGFDPNVVTLAADAPDAPLTKALVTRPEVGIVDYTGGSAFGNWIEDNARQAVVFTEKAGVNSTIVDSMADMKSFAGNLGFSLSLYSGQMCTTPQNIFIPRDGVDVGGERQSFEEVAAAIVGAVDWWLGDAKRGAEVAGAIQNEATLQRVARAASAGGEVLRKSAPIANEQFADARTASPQIMKVDASQTDLFMCEMFGPIAYIIATDNTEHSVALAAQIAREQGAITCGAYATDEKRLREIEDPMVRAGVPVSCNLTGPIYVNQSAAFSDFHVSGANPAGNACLCDGAYVANRFRVVQTRVPV